MRCTKRAENARGIRARSAAAPRGSAGATLRASHGGRSSLRRRLAPRDVLEAEFDRLAQGQPVVVVDAAAAAPLLAELIEDGDLGDDELRQMWGPGARDRAGFVALCEAVGDLFEDEDEDLVAAPPPRAPAPAACRLRPGASALAASRAARRAARARRARVETLSDPRCGAAGRAAAERRTTSTKARDARRRVAEGAPGNLRLPGSGRPGGAHV